MPWITILDTLDFSDLITYYLSDPPTVTSQIFLSILTPGYYMHYLQRQLEACDQ